MPATLSLPSSAVRWTVGLCVVGVAGTLSLLHAYQLWFVLARSGYVGPSDPPSVAAFYGWAGAGGILTLVFVVLGFVAARRA